VSLSVLSVREAPEFPSCWEEAALVQMSSAVLRPVLKLSDIFRKGLYFLPVHSVLSSHSHRCE